ncbi:enoyl-CoA hydratase-related protein [Microbacterium sp. A93]|uniref:enoyl-CoA hydratase-related protein n=1 Tax=Microbacterium sp. A93 TaxID=3450716 RepID=UPI003F443C93
MEHWLTESIDDGVLTLTINRPDRRNAMNTEILTQLGTSVRRAAVDDDVAAVVLRGAGSDFSVGGDVAAMAGGSRREVSPDQRISDLREMMEVSLLLHEMPKPTIAAVRGAAAGAGLALAMACDFRIATPAVKLTTAFAKVALSGDYGGSWLLTRIVGPARAREMYLLPEVISGERALELGLVTRLAEDAQLESEAEAMARHFADGPRLAFSLIKENLNLAVSATLGESLDREAANHICASLSDDHREAATAFVEKRPPRFRIRG